MNRRPNKKSRYHTRPKEYHEKQRVYMNEWHKTKEGKAARHRWLKTKAGKAYKARACIRHYHKNREWIANYKIQKGCELCGFNKWPEALDFDHKNPKDKRFNI